MNWLDSSKSIIENISLLSSILGAFFAFIGLYQILLARKVLTITSKRESIVKATEICEKYYDDFLKKVNEIANKLKIEDLPIIKEDINLSIEKEVIESLKNKYPVWNEDVLEELYPFLNSVEKFAFMFISGAADEKTAYDYMGKIYCNYFKWCIPLIIIHRKAKNDTLYFANSEKLYELWYTRLNKKTLESQKKELDNKLKRLKKGYPPFGT